MYISYYAANGGIRLYDKNFILKKHYLWGGKIDYDADENKLWNLFQDKEKSLWAGRQAAEQWLPGLNGLHTGKENFAYYYKGYQHNKIATSLF